MSNAKDIYYLDALNGYGYDTNGNASFLNHTMRLYVSNMRANYDENSGKKTGENINSRLILVAPLIQLPALSGQNSWEAAGSSFRDLIGEAWKQANDNIRKLKEGIADSVLTEQAAAELKKTTGYITDSPVTSLKIYAGSEISIPNSITATYYSGDPADFGWFEGVNTVSKITNLATGVNGSGGQSWISTGGGFTGEKISGKQPLKELAKNLIPICLGTFEGGRSKDETGTIFNQINVRTPANYIAPAHKWTDDATQGTFTLHIGKGMTVTGLLVSDISIIPSKLLTPDGDYYSMTVTINLTQGRKYYANEMIGWINNNYDQYGLINNSGLQESNNFTNTDLYKHPEEDSEKKEGS